MKATEYKEPEWQELIAAKTEFAIDAPGDWWPHAYCLWRMFATVYAEAGAVTVEAVDAYCLKHYGHGDGLEDPVAQGVEEWVQRALGPDGTASAGHLRAAYAEWLAHRGQ